MKKTVMIFSLITSLLILRVSYAQPIPPNFNDAYVQASVIYENTTNMLPPRPICGDCVEIPVGITQPPIPNIPVVDPCCQGGGGPIFYPSWSDVPSGGGPINSSGGPYGDPDYTPQGVGSGDLPQGGVPYMPNTGLGDESNIFYLLLLLLALILESSLFLYRKTKTFKVINNV